VWLDGSVGVAIQGGTGKDGSNNLTGAGPLPAYLGTVAGIPLVYPLTCEIHVNTSPDEVYVVLNYSISYYSMMAWGISDVPGLTGTGNWYHATRCAQQGSREYHSSPGGIQTGINFGVHADGFPLFMCYSGSNGSSLVGGSTNSFIHGDVDGLGWNANSGDGSFPNTNLYIEPLLSYQPNFWNNETVLLPFPIHMQRSAGNKNTLVGDLKHIRQVRIDYREPGEIVTLGSDKWKLYPWFRKEITVRDGGAGTTHSGTMGCAVRYTGP
jgi:hypothetical protein